MYAKLIFRNVTRFARDYLIYVVTMTICVTLFYAFLSITSQFYHPNLGVEYEFTLIGDGMKMAICAVTLLLLFLIRYVNHYMMQRKQKEFAVQSVMGMEQNTVAWMFFAETFFMGAISIGLGIVLGAFCSQFITGMLLSVYGQEYRLSWMLFPDTVFFTIVFFSLSFLSVGLLNVRTIRKIKIIDMLYAERKNEPHIKKSRYMRGVAGIHLLALVWMAATGISEMYYYSDPRFPFPVHAMFWGNIVAPAVSALFCVTWFVLHKKYKKRGNGKKWNFTQYLLAAVFFSLVNLVFAASVPVIQAKYYLSGGSGMNNKYFTFLLVEVIFVICCIIYLASNLLSEWKEKKPEHKYKGSNLFFFGQIISKLNTTSKTMTLICLTLVLSVFLFVAAPALTGWASGYLNVRSLYDVQISTHYNQVYEEENLPGDDYELVTAFLEDKGIETAYDCIYNLYLPEKTQFQNRVKLDFPVVAMSLSDYNEIRRMLGYEQVVLKDGEFTTQWKRVATEEERADFLNGHATVLSDAGTLRLASASYYEESIGETAYNLYTNVIYIFPDDVCQNLLSVMRNRYIRTEETIPYQEAVALENAFVQKYSEEPDGETGVQYYIRTSTRQINDTIAGNFILQATMTYGAVVLMVICLTILSLQQLLDAAHYKYRFGVLRRLGVDQEELEHLVLKQLAVWFGLPILVAVFVSIIVVVYFFEMISAQISAYIGFGVLLTQVGMMACVFALLLICYFVSTWILFKRSI